MELFQYIGGLKSLTLIAVQYATHEHVVTGGEIPELCTEFAVSDVS